eukprot:gene4565-6438_t
MLDYSEISITHTNVSRTDPMKPNKVFIDIFINSDSKDNDRDKVDLEAIVFRNFYAASLSVSQQVHTSSLTSSTSSLFNIILENYVIMRNPYTEEGGQSWVSINVKEFNHHYVKGKSFRFTLFQPGPMWQKFEIKDIKFYGKSRLKLSGLNTIKVPTLHPQENICDKIMHDFKILNDAGIQQSKLKSFAESYMSNESTGNPKKSGKWKDKRKDKNRGGPSMIASLHTSL